MGEAWIEVQHNIRRDPLTDRGVDFPIYEWKGDGDIAQLRTISLIVDGFRPDNRIITMGNLRLRVISHDGIYTEVALDGWKARLYQIVWPLRRWWLWAWYRLIVTLAVWGLADYEPGRIPSWRDIKGLKRAS